MAPPAESDLRVPVDLEHVARLLRDRAGIVTAGPLRATLLSGGRSNLTFLLTDGVSEWVLRRPPLGHVLETAHDMAREVRVQACLGPFGYPVPAILLAVDEPATQFYVMEHVRGTVLRTDQDLGGVPVEQRRAVAIAYIDTLMRLHAVDIARAGLGDFGRPAGFLERQVRRWSRQLAASQSRQVPGFQELAGRLAAAVPASRHAAVVHGDFRLDNMVFDPAADDPLRAVLDWEMSTLGDPLTDLGLVYLFWEGWSGIDNPIAGTPGDHDGYPGWSELAERYRAGTGYALDELTWYQAFACFKLAVILEGIHYRHVQGLTLGEGFARIGAMVSPLVARGLALI